MVSHGEGGIFRTVQIGPGSHPASYTMATESRSQG